MTRSSKLPKNATSATGRNKIVPVGPSEAGPTPVLVGGGVATRLGRGVDVAMGVGVGVAVTVDVMVTVGVGVGGSGAS